MTRSAAEGETSPSALVEPAPAKVNLDLLVTGRRADGYHELDSLVVFAPFGDRVSVAAAASLDFAAHGPFADRLPAAEATSVVKAARRLARRFPEAAGSALRLEKTLPVAAGIGGGSSDAAAALRGLVRLHRLPIAAFDLREMGLELGADVPVCLYARTARMRGIGERLDPVRGLPPLPLLLVNPGVAVATGAVFAARAAAADAAADAGDAPAKRPPLPARPSPLRFLHWLEASANDLEAAACTLAPAVAETLELIRRQPGLGLARMSGSGPTCYGLFASERLAHEAARAIRTARPGWWTAAGLVATAD